MIKSAAVIIQTVGHELGPSSLVAYSITAVLFGALAFIPVSRLAADALGRRWAFVLFIALFSLGSALAAGAQAMPMFIAGRVLQGARTMLSSTKRDRRRHGRRYQHHQRAQPDACSC